MFPDHEVQISDVVYSDHCPVLVLLDPPKRELLACRAELEYMFADASAKWRQHAKAHWLRDGHRNTKFFHAKASSRAKQNRILRMKNGDRSWCSTTDEMRGLVASYF
ncbi:hypothetical protein Salat_1188300 [Sesamum alatum]|uniref:Uncharacterized protein n=1 Tax=Sesamum alatum TaxID=300844 RepID=A0AAE2CP03_9LAMI|nr:hypothetical protein Salat_1188300 [Sesamum alatum]